MIKDALQPRYEQPIQEKESSFLKLREFLQNETLQKMADKLRSMSFEEYVMMRWTLFKLEDVVRTFQDLDLFGKSIEVQNEEKKGIRFFTSFTEMFTGNKERNSRAQQLHELGKYIFEQGNENISLFLVDLYSQLMSGTLNFLSLARSVEMLTQHLMTLEPQVSQLGELLNYKHVDFEEPHRLFSIFGKNFSRNLHAFGDLTELYVKFNDPEAHKEDELFYKDYFLHFQEEYKKHQRLAEKSAAMSEAISHLHPDEIQTKKLSDQEELTVLLNSLVEANTGMLVSFTLPNSATSELKTSQAKRGIHSLVSLGFSDPDFEGDALYKALRGMDRGRAFNLDINGSAGSLSFNHRPDPLLWLPADIVDTLTTYQTQEIFKKKGMVLDPESEKFV